MQVEINGKFSYMKCYSFSENPIDFDLIDTLFKSSFNQSLNSDYWNWRFLHNPVSTKVYINYLMDGDKLIAYYAVSPCEINIDNKTYKIALSNMTMTHPDYTRRGYFKLLATNLFEDLRKDDFIGVYGFANTNSHHGFKKNLGWKDLAALNMFSLVKDDFNKELLEHEVQYTLKNSILSRDDLLAIDELNFTDSSIHLSRSKGWLNWRLIENPNNDYYSLKIYGDSDLRGVVIYKKYLKSIDIMEIFYKNKINKFEMLNIAINHLLTQDTLNLNCWANLQSDEYSMMEKVGFKEGEFNTNFGIIPFIKNEKLLDVKNWHYRFIDSDVF